MTSELDEMGMNWVYSRRVRKRERGRKRGRTWELSGWIEECVRERERGKEEAVQIAYLMRHEAYGIGSASA
jgi:hypothetical protein